MSTYAWFKSEYWRFADIAKDQSEILYFDSRHWTMKDITRFFADLKYADYETYECVIRRFPQYKITNFKIITANNQNAEQRYLAWLHEHKQEWNE
jgi:hypothetical protein